MNSPVSDLRTGGRTPDNPLMNLSYLFYSLMFYLAVPLILLRLAWRSLREPLYRETMAERFGFCASTDKQPVWVHSVSAGETIAAVPLVRQLLTEGYPVWVTTMTPTGRERVRGLLGEHLGKTVFHSYAPYDLPDAIHRFLERVKPRALIIIDTELWPNMIRETSRRGIPVFLVNGRLSEKSARGYGRIPALSRPMFTALTQVFAQTRSHAAHFEHLGVKPESAEVTGSIKFDLSFPDDFEDRVSKLANQFGDRQVFLAASTHDGEEQVVLDAYEHLKTLEPQLLVLAPRHPHRTEDVIRELKKRELDFVRHSSGDSVTERTRVYLLDTLGELLYFYGAATYCFVGGSLIDRGGHNPMEPASLGIPASMGPYRRNIADIAAEFESAGALAPVTDARSLQTWWQEVADSESRRLEMRRAALDVMARHRGALDKCLAKILKTLSST